MSLGINGQVPRIRECSHSTFRETELRSSLSDPILNHNLSTARKTSRSQYYDRTQTELCNCVQCITSKFSAGVGAPQEVTASLKLTDFVARPILFEYENLIFEIIRDEVENGPHRFKNLQYFPVGCQVGVQEDVVAIHAPHEFLIDSCESEPHIVGISVVLAGTDR